MRGLEYIIAERERREARAATRAATLQPGLDLYADGFYVMARYSTRFDEVTRKVVIECESHWDACLVLLAYGKVKADAEV